MSSSQSTKFPTNPDCNDVGNTALGTCPHVTISHEPEWSCPIVQHQQSIPRIATGTPQNQNREPRLRRATAMPPWDVRIRTGPSAFERNPSKWKDSTRFTVPLSWSTHIGAKKENNILLAGTGFRWPSFFFRAKLHSLNPSICWARYTLPSLSSLFVLASCHRRAGKLICQI
jgi:hypothetical protein